MSGKLAPRKIAPQSGSRFGLGLALELGLGGNFPRIFKLILVLPTTNASSKRSFSLLRLVKSYLRATAGEGRLNHLMILSAYKEKVDELNLKDVAREFIHKNDTRISLFGKI